MRLASQWSGLFLGVALGLGACSSVTPETGPVEQVQESPTRALALTGQRNFRDLGGYKTQTGDRVKWGRLYRAGELSKLTEADYAILSLRDIGKVVDFRSGVRTVRGFNYVGNCPVSLNFWTCPSAAAQQIGPVNYPNNCSREILRKMRFARPLSPPTNKSQSTTLANTKCLFDDNP